MTGNSQHGSAGGQTTLTNIGTATGANGGNRSHGNSGSPGTGGSAGAAPGATIDITTSVGYNMPAGPSGRNYSMVTNTGYAGYPQQQNTGAGGTGGKGYLVIYDNSGT